MPDKKSKDDERNLTSDFADLASHQLRTPLSGMKWMLELLQRPSSGTLNKKQKEYVEKIAFFNQRLITLVNDLLEVSKVERGKTKLYLQPTDLTVIIRSVLKDKEKEIKKKGLIVSFKVEQEPFPVVRTEPSKIKQAFNNLFDNALAYTHDNGKVHIDLVLIKGKNDMLQCSVTDTGVGIPQNDQKQIFSKFFRAANVSKIESVGTGLGLYIAKAFIEASQGKIWFKSKPGEGTTFTFTLPIVRK